MTKALTTTDYGPLWKELRRSFHVYMSKTAVRQYMDAFEREGRNVALRVLDGINDPLDGARLLVARTPRVETQTAADNKQTMRSQTETQLLCQTYPWYHLRDQCEIYGGRGWCSFFSITHSLRRWIANRGYRLSY